MFIALLFVLILGKFQRHGHPVRFTLIFVIFPSRLSKGQSMEQKKVFTAWMILEQGKWFIMTFWTTAEPDSELKLRNRVTKRVLHVHYIENKVQYMIKNQQDF